MYSIRKLSATLALGLLVFGVGCAKKQPMPAAAVNNQTIATDDVMAKRSWPESKSVYQNTSVPAGPDRFLYEPTNPNNGVWLDTPLFLVNSVVLPFTYFETGPNDVVANSTGAGIGPGYTAIPASQGGNTAGVMDYSGRSQKPQQAMPNAQGSVGGPAAGTGGAAGAGK